MNHQKKHAAIDAPFSLGGLFGGDDEDHLDQSYSVTDITLNTMTFRIRQFAYHRANANQIWPGTFTLCDFLASPVQLDKMQGATVLELGAATGALAIALSSPPYRFNIQTSDFADDGEVEGNIAFNFALNGLVTVGHIPHTWGTGWQASCQKVGIARRRYDYIIASDILLYVSAYPALVETLCELFEIEPETPSHTSEVSRIEFIMIWNRRISESLIFFDLMVNRGFETLHYGSCIYGFTRPKIKL